MYTVCDGATPAPPCDEARLHFAVTAQEGIGLLRKVHAERIVEDPCGEFVREWSKATVQMDCKTYTPTITMK